MNLPALALFERSLRLESRSALMTWSRVGLLGIILFVLLPTQAAARAGIYSAPGLDFLEEMVVVNFAFITLAGLSYFASAITEEKEEMMLGLLRMTDLNAVAILLGKSTSRLVGASLLLIVQVPFILLAVTLGGVGLLQITAAYGTLLAYLFLLCNLALLFSVVFRNTAIAAGVTLLFLLLFLIGPYCLKGIEQIVVANYGVNLNAGFWPVVNDAISVWRRANPPERLVAVFATGFKGPVIDFQIVSNLSAGVVFFLLAWIVFEPCARAEKGSRAARKWFWQRTTRRSRVPAGLKGLHAITWKDFTFISGGTRGLLLKIGVLGVLVAFCAALRIWNDDQVTMEDFGGMIIWLSVVLTAIWLSVDASRVFKEEVRWKTLSSLTMLPFSVREIAFRKVIGALAGTLPLLVGLFIGCLLAPNGVMEYLKNLFKSPEEFASHLLWILQFIQFLHLTAFLSLVIKRGALPLAIGIQVAGWMFFGIVLMFFTALRGEAAVVLFATAFICAVIIAVLHSAIGTRLGRLVAEE